MSENNQWFGEDRMEFQITPDALEFMRKESEGSSLRFFTKKS